VGDWWLRLFRKSCTSFSSVSVPFRWFGVDVRPQQAGPYGQLMEALQRRAPPEGLSEKACVLRANLLRSYPCSFNTTTMVKGEGVKMKYLKYSFVLVFVVCAISATAQVPSGTFGYVFTNTLLWDATSITTNVVSATETATIILDLTEYATGKIIGTLMASVSDGAEENGTISGNVTVRNGVLGSTLTIRGTAAADGKTGPATGEVTATLDTNNLTLLIVGEDKACVNTKKGPICDTFPINWANALPADVTGDWSLTNSITANGDKLSGTGTLTLSNGRYFNYKITGGYSTKGVGTLILAGQGEAVGTSLSLKTQGTEMTLTNLTGKVLGETLTIK